MPILRLTLFWCRDADPRLQQTPLLLTAARAFAQSVGFDIEVLPQTLRDPAFVLGDAGPVVAPADHDAGPQTVVDRANQRVRGRAHSAFQRDGRLPIIFGKLGPLRTGEYRGQTVMAYTTSQGVVVRSDWLPWCLVDPATAQAEGQTLLHEVAHAAGAGHSEPPAEYPGLVGLAAPAVPPGDLMTEGGTYVRPVTIRAETLDLLRRAYFCW